MNGSDLSTYLLRVPFLAQLPLEEVGVTRLAGLTNVNFLLTAGSDRYVLRVPGKGTSEYINRTNESVAAHSASRAGVNAELLHFDDNDGLMVTRFVDDARTMTAEAFAADLGAVGRAGEVFRRLHASATPFSVPFALFSMVDEYKALLEAKGAGLPSGYGDVQSLLGAARSALEAAPVSLVPSHCDPLCENFLDTGSSMFLIDYEYAGNNDPMWDLADLSVEGGFTEEQDNMLLRSYFSGSFAAEQQARMVIYKAMCDLLWTLWGAIQHANGNPADDFWAYALGRFERCQRLTATDSFHHHVEYLVGR